MSRSNKRKSFESIRNLSELRTERMRTKLLLEIRERDISDDVSGIKNYFSWANISSNILSGTESVCNIFQTAYEGFNIVHSAVSGMKAGRKKRKEKQKEQDHDCPYCGCEEGDCCDCCDCED